MNGNVWTILIGSFVMTAFFWLRGIWKNRRADLIVGCLLLFFSFSTCGMVLDLLNAVGVCLMALGALTIVVGRSGSRIAARDVYTCGVAFLLLGSFLSLLL
jgi:hypothetical protein